MELMKREEALLRSASKTELILEFLKHERWTTQYVVQLLLALNSRQATHKTLMKLERDQLVRRFSVHNESGRKKTLWGLTQNGLMMSVKSGENFEDYRTFEPSKFKSSIMEHELILQEVRIKLERTGWTGWKTEGWHEKGAKAPDALTTNPSGKIIAIEVERTLKSYKRYKEIVLSHLKCLSKGIYNEVHYIAPSKSIRDKLKQIFNSINDVRHKGQLVLLTDKHKAPFKFMTIEEICGSQIVEKHD